MAKRRSMPIEDENPYGLNEVDDFAAKREKVMLADAGFNQREDDEDDFSVDDEEEVMAMSDNDSEESLEEDGDEDENEDELDGEAAYKEVFGRKLDLGDDPELDNGGMLDNENAWGTSKTEYYGADDLNDEATAKEIEKEASFAPAKATLRRFTHG